jgi:hypothetical protein
MPVNRNNEAMAKYTWRPFEEARDWLRALDLKTGTEWKKWAKSKERPPTIPKGPWHIYQDKWINMGDWLGTGSIAPQNREYRAFEEARDFVRGLGLKSGKEWRAWAQTDAKPPDIPANPMQVYKDKWTTMGDWLGTGYVAHQNRTYRPFEQARDFVRGLGLTSMDEWKAWAASGARPADIPAYPAGVYKNQGWAGWRDWLGPRPSAPETHLSPTWNHEGRVARPP